MKKIDETVSKKDDEHCRLSQDFGDLLHLLPKRRIQSRRIMSLKQVVDSINGSSEKYIDLTKSNDVKPVDALKSIPIKFLKFAEDVRPPYTGTYSKQPIQGSISSLARKPLGRVRPDTNYDYDSEAEWEDPVDGEDLDSEGEEEDEDEDEEEMEGFLDDEEPNAVKRRPLLGDQEPTCSGICWEGEKCSSNGKLPPDLSPYRIDILLGKCYSARNGPVLILFAENPCFPIDPFSTTYWAPARPEKTSNTHLPGNQPTHPHATPTNPPQSRQPDQHSPQTPNNKPNEEQSAQSPQTIRRPRDSRRIQGSNCRQRPDEDGLV